MKVIDNVPRDLWDRVVARCSYATFFHTSTWAEILVLTYAQFHIATKGFVLDDGVTVIVPLIGTTERNGYFKWYESMFPGAYGGAVAERDLARREINYIFQYLADTHTAYIHVMGNPYADQCLPPSYNRSLLYTHVLNLDKGFDAIFKNYSTGHKRCTKKAKKMGVEICVAESGEEFRSYYEVYEDSLRRWGDNTLESYPYNLFEQIYHCRSETMKLWVAKVEDEIISGCLVFYHNRHVVYWNGATRESHFNYRPSHLLMTEIIRDACQRGFDYFDFNPSGGLEGVERFKKSFGAQPMHFYSYTWNGNRVYQTYQKARGLALGVLKGAIHSAAQ